MYSFHLDTIAVALSALLVLTYYVYLFTRLRRRPDFTIHAVNRRARQLWVAEVMKNGSKDVMAVQTLRNYMMAATFKASSTVLFIMGTLTLSGQAESLAKTWHVLNIVGTQEPQWWIIKVICLLTVLIVAFFSFALTVRLLNHVVFMISLPPSEAHGPLSAEHVAQRLNQAGVFYSIGMRAFFIAVPLVFWLFGAAFLVGATIGLIGVLYLLNRNPMTED